MKQKKEIELEKLDAKKFNSLEKNQMTKLCGGGHVSVATTTCYPGGGYNNDGDDSGW